MGAGAACAAVIRAYVSSATSLEERTSCLANIAASQGIGFIVYNSLKKKKKQTIF